MSETIAEVRDKQSQILESGRDFLTRIKDSERWRRDLIRAIHDNNKHVLRRRGFRGTHISTHHNGKLKARHNQKILKWLLRSLRISEMTDRENRIPDAFKETFEWVYRDPPAHGKKWSSFRAFLEQPHRAMYWITGKPGSGKSTLMKFLTRNPRTFEHLYTWTTEIKLISASFYFWNSGSDMQMSVEGLLRSILWQCLTKLSTHVPEILPERWEAYALFGEDDYPWSLQELRQALNTMVLDVCPQLDFFFMIDGLDECSGDQAQVINLILELVESTPNLKVCVASRPWALFADAFRETPQLKLQDLTFGDIKRYVTLKFNSSPGFLELKRIESEYATRLLTEIARKADGVFLWVSLVVMSLLEGLRDGDRIHDLQRRLEHLPPTLEELFEKMLQGLTEAQLSHASQLFQLIRASHASPTVLCIALADLDDNEYALAAPIRPFSEDQILGYYENMKRKLMSRCRCLLETNYYDEPLKSDSVSGESEAAPIGETYALPSEKAPWMQEIQYLHRTVKDWIEEPRVWNWILGATQQSFNPALSLCKSYLLQLKGYNPKHLSMDTFWNIVISCIAYAKDSEGLDKLVRSNLLDKLDQTATLITSQPYQGSLTFAEVHGNSDQNSSPHWTSTLINWMSGTTFNYLATMCGMYRYLGVKVCIDDFQNKEEEARPPLLFAAVEDYVALETYAHKFGLVTYRPCLQTIRVLLDKGADPHEMFFGRSPYSIAESMVRRQADFMPIIEIFRGSAGPPPQHQERTSSSKAKKPGSHSNTGSAPLTMSNLRQIKNADKLFHELEAFDGSAPSSAPSTVLLTAPDKIELSLHSRKSLRSRLLRLYSKFKNLFSRPSDGRKSHNQRSSTTLKNRHRHRHRALERT